MKDGDLELPPGFRFHPTDEELVVHYLCRKCSSLSITVPIITEIDLYKFDPWQLPGMASYGEKEWYFFSPRDRKYPNGSRPNRAAGSGYWKATGADKPIGNPKPIGIKKALVFYAGKAPRGLKTNWIMHEYRLADVDRSARKNNNSSRLDDWVLCRLYNKKGSTEKEFDIDKKYTPSLIRKSETEDQKPLIPLNGQNMSVPLQSSLINDYHYLDASDSIPKLHTESSCSEHVVSPEFTCEREVQSEPTRWMRGGGDWARPLDMPFITTNNATSSSNIGDIGNNNNYYAQFDNNGQLSPLQDMFMYLHKPF